MLHFAVALGSGFVYDKYTGMFMELLPKLNTM
jgi:hypothetical protein